MSLNQHFLWARRPPTPAPVWLPGESGVKLPWLPGRLGKWGVIGAPERALCSVSYQCCFPPLPVGSPNTDNSQAPSLDRDVPSWAAGGEMSSPITLPGPVLGVCFPVTRRISPWIPWGRAAKVSQCRGQAGLRMDGSPIPSCAVAPSSQDGMAQLQHPAPAALVTFPEGLCGRGRAQGRGRRQGSSSGRGSTPGHLWAGLGASFRALLWWAWGTVASGWEKRAEGIDPILFPGRVWCRA